MDADARPHAAAPPGAPTSTADATRPRGGGRFRTRRRRTAGETRRRLPRGRAERRRTTVDARLGKKRKKRVNGPSRVRRPPMTERSATTTTTTTRSPAPPRARGRSIFFFPPQTREFAKEPQKSRARSRVPPRSPPRPRARVSRRGPRRRRPPRRAAIPKTRAKTATSQKKHILRRSASGASPPAWRSRSAPRAAGETTASPSRPLVPRRGATGRGGAGTRERPRAFWGKARDASSRRRRLRQPPFPKTEYWSLCRALGAATRGTATGRASSRTGRATANCARVCGVRSRRATET